MVRVSRRESLVLGVSIASALSIATGTLAAVGPVSGTKVYEQTLLKAKPGLRADLGRFIQANWFPMDQRGLEKGIFTSYWLLEETGENAAWDYVMVVGYPTELGYSDPRTLELFQAIRNAHVEVKIGGKGLRELGDIVGSHRLMVVSP